MVFVKNRFAYAEKKAVYHQVALPVLAILSYDKIASSTIKNLSACIGKSSVNDSGSTVDLPATSNFYSTSSGVTGYVTYSFDVASVINNLPNDAELDMVTFIATAGRENASKGSMKAYAVHYHSSDDQTIVGAGSAEFTSTSSETKYVASWTKPNKSTLNEYALRVEVEYYGGHLDGATMLIGYYTYE